MIDLYGEGHTTLQLCSLVEGSRPERRSLSRRDRTCDHVTVGGNPLILGVSPFSKLHSSLVHDDLA